MEDLGADRLSDEEVRVRIARALGWDCIVRQGNGQMTARDPRAGLSVSPVVIPEWTTDEIEMGWLEKRISDRGLASTFRDALARMPPGCEVPIVRRKALAVLAALTADRG